MAELGEPGTEDWMDVELRLVADVGIVGVPNAGKSTLLASLSAARPKVAPYPFTTLVPNLGVCELDFTSTVFADVPGLLEGAHAGVGLGHEFLRHVSRCRAIVHVVDGGSPDPVGDFAAIRAELGLFSPALAAMPQVVAYNKVDLPDSADYYADVAAHLTAVEGVHPNDIIAVSAATGLGATDLVRRVRVRLAELRTPDGPVRATDAVNATTPPRKAVGLGAWDIEFEGPTRTWSVTGAGLERFVAQTNWDYYEAALRFQRVLEAAGIANSLRARGVKEGDTVIVGGAELVWSDDRSEAALFEGWLSERKAAGRVTQGSHAWPHAGGS
jgi:GTP-binding protein